MSTKRKPTRRTAARVALRVNGKPVVNGAGAKLAAEWLGCTQTTGSQVGRGNVRVALEYIGAGDALWQMTSIDDPVMLREVANEADDLSRSTSVTGAMAETLRATAAALRNAARLRDRAQS